MGRPMLSPAASYWTAAGVLLVSLWASGAPAMLYPVFAARWGSNPVVTTALFAVYPMALVLVMVLGGSLSDRFGRRRSMLTGVAAIAAGTALFAVADPPALVFAGRILQGAGVGLAMSAASAALVEFDRTSDSNRASAVNNAATAIGATVAILVGGALAEYTGESTHLAYRVLLAVVVALLVALFFFPDTQTLGMAPRTGRWALLTVPSTRRRVFMIGVSAMTVAFVTGAVFLALGAQIIRELVGATNALHAAAALAAWPAATAATSLLAHRLVAATAAALGGGVAAAGFVLLLLSDTGDSLILFLGSAVLAGIGFGLLVYSALRLVASTAPTGRRASAFSSMYLCAYLAQGSTAVLIGALATSTDLDTAILTATPVITALCLTIAGVSRYAR